MDSVNQIIIVIVRSVNKLPSEPHRPTLDASSLTPAACAALLRETVNPRLEDHTPYTKDTPLPKAQFVALCASKLPDAIGYTPRSFRVSTNFSLFRTLRTIQPRSGSVAVSWYVFLRFLFRFQSVALFTQGSTASMTTILTIFHWAKLSVDAVGRRPIVLGSTLVSAFTCLLFGLSRSLVHILALRAISASRSGVLPLRTVNRNA
ncbi:hypothetical protein FB451DRAFT_66989 [Mycena latifolia]|nr:hypothetical protein FB451DRAFT_66989 [Mycena latifolia]